MKRDGACTSLWQDTTKDYESGNRALTKDKVYDVLIVGGGMTGISTGLLLQKAGKSVMIAEAHTIGFGTTGGTTAHLNTFMDHPYNEIEKKFSKDDAKLVAKAAKQAINLVRSNVNSYNIDCGFRELDGYVFSQDDKQDKELHEMIEASQEAGVEVELTNDIPVTIPCIKAARFANQATFHPTRYLSTLADEFEKAGGTLLEHCRVTGIDEGEPHLVKTSIGNFRTHFLIYATHIPPGVNLLHFRCAPYRSYAMAFKLKDESAYPDALVYDMYDPYHYYRTQEIDGEKYFIAGGEDHKTGHEENTEACFRNLQVHVEKHFEVEEITHRWSSQYYESNDGLPYIGQLPGHPENMYVGTGYGGNGMIYSNVAAIMLSDIILKGDSEFAELFDPNRIKMVAGFSNFVKESADVVGKLIGKILPKEKLQEFSDLAPGEARVVKYDGHQLAVYKDEEGMIYTVNSACTHIKCDVAWNNAEKSWDCPCHGSRFHYTGEMLCGPARKDLEQVDVSRAEEKVDSDRSSY